MTAPEEIQPVDDFPIGAALSVALGAVGLSDSAPGPYCTLRDLYAILGRLLGDVPTVEEMPDAAEQARAALLAQHPALSEATLPENTSDTGILTWLAEQEAAFGATLRIKPVAVQ